MSTPVIKMCIPTKWGDTKETQNTQSYISHNATGQLFSAESPCLLNVHLFLLDNPDDNLQSF